MPEFLYTKDNIPIAFDKHRGKPPVIIYVPGFLSHMEGTKAHWLAQRCRERSQAFLRFDYRGHGNSGGDFKACSLEDWLDDLLMIIDRAAEGPLVAAGSSMGGWLALLAALRRPERIRGLIGIATAVGFTERIFYHLFDPQERCELEQQGVVWHYNPYLEKQVPITRELIHSGRKYLLQDRQKLKLDIPVRLIHGKKDHDIPWQVSRDLHRKIGHKQSRLVLVQDGEHRLSREQDLELIDRYIAELSQAVDPVR